MSDFSFRDHDELDAAVDALKAKGVVFEQEPVDQSWLWREARLRDPSGNQICLYQAARNAAFRPGAWKMCRIEIAALTINQNAPLRDGMRD